MPKSNAKSSAKSNKGSTKISNGDIKPIEIDETIIAGKSVDRGRLTEDVMRDMIMNKLFKQMEKFAPLLEDFNSTELGDKVEKILGKKEIDVNEKNLKIYRDYLKKTVQQSCYLTGYDQFDWEEEYFSTHGSQKGYEKLKKTQPSYTDTFKLLGFKDWVDDEYGILVDVQRTNDNKKFTLPLADLEAADEDSADYDLLDDYSMWFFNYM